MWGKIILGAMTLAAILSQVDYGVAAGAVAVGLPSDVAKQGVSIGAHVNANTMDEAKSRALAQCKSFGSPLSKSLCKVVATFQNQCVANTIDPRAGTPGFGWAIADTPQAASEQAMANCRDSDGPAHKEGCKLAGAHPILCDGSAK
jgi:hypothetical protein